MHNFLTLNPIIHVNGIVNLPGSKSISNRALLLAAQAVGITRLNNLLDSDDVKNMLVALSQLGVNYYLSTNRRTCEIQGIGGPLYADKELTLFLYNTGTAMRMLTAALCLQTHSVILSGEYQMKRRPIGHLVDALRQGKAQIDYLERYQYPPIRLRGGYIGGNIAIDCSLSSQFLTALLIMSPLAPKDSCIRVKGTLVSRPYIDITIALMKIFGVTVSHSNYKVFYLSGNRKYRSPGNLLIEGDASSASYFLAAAAIRGGTVRTVGINKNSIQGDIQFANVLEQMGAVIRWGENYVECSRSKLRPINIDVNHIPDAAMTIAMVALFTKGGVTTLRNIASWRVKETDRLMAMANELRRIGAKVIEGKDYLLITPPTTLSTACINTYKDHRIAMCFSLVALSNVPITICDPQCTYKTFPNFFNVLSDLSTH